MHVDLPLDELRNFRPTVAEPADFDAFWSAQLATAREHDLDATFEPHDAGLATVEVFDVTFTGHGGARIRAWLVLPRHLERPLPTVVQYLGYGGGRGYAHQWLTFASAGFAHLVMDTRGQGSAWARGDTPDPGDPGTPSIPGFFTRGVADRDGYYYVRLYVDAVRAVDAAAAHPAVDAGRIAVAGGSQGGALALAAANLSDLPIAVMADVPFLSNIERAVTLTDADPYHELTRWCRIHHDQVEQAFTTLSYVDVVNHGKRTELPALFAVALADDICPPSTVFSAVNTYAGDSEVRIYPFDTHDGGGAHQVGQQLAFARRHLGASPAPSTDG